MTCMTKIFDLLVAGGGPAGLFAAYNAAANGAKVILFEKEDRCGKKLDITGKGRCNITNLCDRDEFLANVPRNPRFLFAALSAFPPEETVSFFESLGVGTKLERGKRIFPVSDRAHDVTAALINACKSAGVVFSRGKITEVLTDNGAVTGAVCNGKTVFSSSVLLACGGASYPRTGSDGNGFLLAEKLGHTIAPIRPSLVPLVSPDRLCRDCMGLSLKNVGLCFFDKNGKKVYSEQGEMMFTHFGLTGPVILSGSAYLRNDFPYTLKIDLKPALDKETLDKRLLRDFSENINKELKNGFSALLPQKLIDPFVKMTGIPPETRLNSLKKEQRSAIADLMKSIPVTVTGTRPISEAIITSGGVDCREINPKTMESRLVSGLYFAGEIIDVDAYTGGFNLQIAFSTAYLAGQAVVRK